MVGRYLNEFEEFYRLRDEERLNAEIAQERAEREDFIGSIEALLNLNKFGALNPDAAFPVAIGMLEKAVRYLRDA